MTRLNWLKDALTRTERSVVMDIVWLLGSIAAPTLVRLAVDPLVGDTLWFPTYCPALPLVTLFRGWMVGVCALLSSAALANWLFMTPRFTLSHKPAELAGMLIYLLAAGLIIVTTEALRIALKELNELSAREHRLNEELRHRVQNNLVVVQGLAVQTAKTTPEPAAFVAAFAGRLQALARAHEILFSSQWNVCELPDLAQEALAAFDSGGRVITEGPRCTIPQRSCVPLVMALHELATNATKYGALSATGGVVRVTWALAAAAQTGHLVLRWTESGGPRVAPPSRRGLGSRLLSTQQGLESVRLEFHEEGVTCEIVVPGASLTYAAPVAERAASLPPWPAATEH